MTITKVFNRATSSQPLFVTPAHRILQVRLKRLEALKAESLITPDRLHLMNPRFQPQHVQAAPARVSREMHRQQPAQTAPAKWRTHIHALDFAILSANNFYTPASG